MPVPVYLFTGFLDSGKTTFLQNALEDDRFQNNKDRTLLLLAEEGECELDLSRVQGQVKIVSLTEKEQWDYRTLEDLYKRSRAQRVIIEYNGMWLLSDLQQAMPKSWQLYQVMMMADATTMDLYDSNMRQLVADKIAASEMVAFNRVTAATDKMKLHQLVRGVNRRAQILYEYIGGHTEIDDIEDPLPFDMDAEVIEVEDEDFGLLYMDCMDNPEKYHGKQISLRMLSMRSPKLPNDQFVAGRIAVTCCADDASLIGFPAFAPAGVTPQNRPYYRAVGTLMAEHHAVYGEVGPVLYVTDMQEADKPADEWVYFR